MRAELDNMRSAISGINATPDDTDSAIRRGCDIGCSSGQVTLCQPSGPSDSTSIVSRSRSSSPEGTMSAMAGRSTYSDIAAGQSLFLWSFC